MKVYSTLRALENSLSEVIEEEENKILRDNLKDDLSEKAKSAGIIDASKYAIFVIKSSEMESKSKRKITREQVIPTLRNKINNCIHELMKAEKNYTIKATARLEYDIVYYESIVDMLQAIRGKIDEAFE